MQLELIKGDITKLSVDAIVNAANESLLGGGGVDGAIHRAGGKSILAECKRIVKQQGHCKTGEAVVTTAGNLPSKYVIHAVGPVWQGGAQNEEKLLASAYRNSLELAAGKGLATVAFPNISTGVYGFPKELAASIAIETVVDFLKTTHAITKVVFVCFDDENHALYKALLPEAA